MTIELLLGLTAGVAIGEYARRRKFEERCDRAVVAAAVSRVNKSFADAKMKQMYGVAVSSSFATAPKLVLSPSGNYLITDSKTVKVPIPGTVNQTFDLQVPTTEDGAVQMDRRNGTTYWCDAILEEKAVVSRTLLSNQPGKSKMGKDSKAAFEAYMDRWAPKGGSEPKPLHPQAPGAIVARRLGYPLDTVASGPTWDSFIRGGNSSTSSSTEIETGSAGSMSCEFIIATIQKEKDEQTGVVIQQLEAGGPFFIGNILDTSPFQGTSLKEGYELVSINGKLAKTYSSLSALVAAIKSIEGALSYVAGSSPSYAVVATIQKAQNEKTGVVIKQYRTGGPMMVSKIADTSPFKNTPLEEGHQIVTMNGKLATSYGSFSEFTAAIKSVDGELTYVARKV